MKALAFVLGLAVLAMGAVSFAADDAVKTQDVTGKVAVTKDDKGEATKITITAADDKVLEVKLDAEGKKLAVDDGKMVKATGTIDGKVITVTKFSVVEKKAPAKKAVKVE